MATKAPALRPVGRPLGSSSPELPHFPEDRLETFISRLRIVIGHGLFDAAHRMIDEAQKEFSEKPETFSLDTPLASTDMVEEMRLLNQLDRMGITTIGDLLSRPRGDLSSQANLGPSGVARILRYARAWQERLERGLSQAECDEAD